MGGAAVPKGDKPSLAGDGEPGWLSQLSLHCPSDHRIPSPPTPVDPFPQFADALPQLGPLPIPITCVCPA